jgi:hypothetical protein
MNRIARFVDATWMRFDPLKRTWNLTAPDDA